MYEREPCVANDSFQIAYQHTRPLDCAGHHRSSFPFNVVSGKHQVSAGEKDHFDSLIQVEASLGFRHNQAAEGTWETEALENGKRSSSNVSCEVVNKRVRHENQAEKALHFAGNSAVSITFEGKLSSEESEWKRAAAGTFADGKSPTVGNLSLPWLTFNTKEADSRLDQPARLSFYLGYEVDCRRTGFDQMEDIYSSFSIHPHRRLVSIGTDHQADLPEWAPQHHESLGSQSGLCDNSALSNATRSSDLANTEASSDKWLGTCIMPMPNLDTMTVGAWSCCSKTDCDCNDEGSIKCVRLHVNEAREKLCEALGQEKFIGIGFSDMGEVVAQRWTEEEENLFHEIVLSNPASLGRNFWIVLPQAFPSRSFKDLVSYYFNVFILRKRADQNRFGPLNVDSDNDEWQGSSSDGEFEMSEDWEEEDESAVESPDEDGLALNINFSAGVDFHDEVYDEEEYKKNLIGTTEDEGFYSGSEGCKEYKSMPTIQLSGRNSADCALDEDVQDDSCTSYEGLHNLSDSCHGHGDGFGRQGKCTVRDKMNLLVEYRNDANIGLADYEHIEGHANSKPWKISYAGSRANDIDFFPTSNVLEEVFGKESLKKDARDGSGFS